MENTGDDKEISLKDVVIKLKEWVEFLFSKWPTIVIMCVIGAILGITYAYIKKPIYKAQLSFALEDDKGSSGLSAAAGLASQFGFDIGGGGGGAFSGDNLMGLMKSRYMVEKALLTSVNIKGKKETLAEYYIIFNKLRDNWKNKPQLARIHFLPDVNRSTFSLQQDSLLGEIYRAITKTDLTVDKTDKKLSIVNIAMASENELFAKYFVENIAKTVSDFYVTTKTKKSEQNVSILQHQTDSVKNELNNDLGGVASSIDATPNINPARQILRTPSQYRQVKVVADQAILTELVKNLEVSKIALRKETPLIQIIDTPILPLEKEKVGRLKGAILGGGIMGFLTVCFFLLKRLIIDLLK
ncbi:lipopolysaccharide biosynthesis protein [Mucilaginibacter mali]|uniref:Lipopolysaccharide biosynthesis protein n=1 Tax=Mucilaginibacter mali TaxID=2740462 RepID=A0A7D4QQZ7_9SPHI|nr:Wzz/FepE/Etk N-terminal domain-containing protein [Mucilaginibacter mali]QKJ29389.1 lipopolysaccharide biosynthesis protein [Mucilaginibacter mali]